MRSKKMMIAGIAAMAVTGAAGAAVAQGVAAAPESAEPRVVASPQLQQLQEQMDSRRGAELRAAQRRWERQEARRAAAAAARQERQEQRRAAAERAAAAAAEKSPAAAKAYAKRYMKQEYGWGEDQYQALVALWTRESDWDYTATNPSSGAFGIPQSLPGNKMAANGKDWRSNPETQIRWGLDYIKQTYGTPTGAWGFFQANNWY